MARFVMKVSPHDIQKFQKEVLGYYTKFGRHDLPWRKTHDPYRIMVSEIMLQQTQVSRVLVKYAEFLHAFPTLDSLARSELKDVLKVWSGLGYNRRGKMLHDAAKKIVELYDGNIPKDPVLLEALPGIGHYTARAIAAFAYNHADAFIETNIRAVFIHHFFPRSKQVDDKKLMPIIAAAVPKGKARIWYWALMDYGVLVKQKYGNPSRKSKHHTMQSKFEGSLRQVRGAILKVLHARDAASEKYLQDTTGFTRERITEALTRLAKDSMVKKSGPHWTIS